jgi:hypothetical protein
MGWLAGLIFQGLYKNGSTKKISYAISSLSAALLNTIFFMSLLIILFGNTDYIKGFQGDMSILPFVVAFVGINGLVEAIVTMILGGTISRSLIRYRQ